MPPLVAFVQNE